MRKPDGWTAFYDALGVYLNGAAEQDGQKILLVYTDGGDTRSSLTFHDLLDLLKASDVTAYVIGYLEHQSSRRGTSSGCSCSGLPRSPADRRSSPTSTKDLDRVYEKIERTICRPLQLRLRVDRPPHGRPLAQVQIRLKRPDLKGVQAAHPRGVFRALQREPLTASGCSRSGKASAGGVAAAVRRTTPPAPSRWSVRARRGTMSGSTSHRDGRVCTATVWHPSTIASSWSRTSSCAAIRPARSTSSSRD